MDGQLKFNKELIVKTLIFSGPEEHKSKKKVTKNKYLFNCILHVPCITYHILQTSRIISSSSVVDNVDCALLSFVVIITITRNFHRFYLSIANLICKFRVFPLRGCSSPLRTYV